LNHCSFFYHLARYSFSVASFTSLPNGLTLCALLPGAACSV
jgi:hypothetical protein